MTATVTTPAQGTADGLVFVAGIGFFGGGGTLLIADNNGEAVYIGRTASGVLTTDFKRQDVGGVPYLVYYTGTPSVNWAHGAYTVLDQSYTVVDTWAMKNGYDADLHELRLLANGHALLLSYTPIPVDLSQYEGPADGIVVDIIIQEQDSAKNVVFEWHASQHIPLTDSYIALSESPVDFMHTNAIEVDTDGNLLLSSRHPSEITKINRQSGAIVWRLGGKSNQFTFTNDGGFSFQHDIRRLGNGDITLFDNGNQHLIPSSRAVEYELDESAKTITRVWQYAQSPASFAPFMGIAQRLANGNTIIGWGALPLATEVHADGTKAFELALGDLTYRAFRYTWSALPAAPPRLAAVYAGDPATVTLFSAWNGATEISGYQVYAGPTSAAMSLITTTLRTGFETEVTLSGLDATTCAFQVRPLHARGVTTPLSNITYRLDQPRCRALLNVRYLPNVIR